MALAVIPGAMLMSFVFARRVRPIYRTVRKDVEQIDGRVGEAFSGIRVVRAFGREVRELLDYMSGRHAVLRKELVAHRRELVSPARTTSVFSVPGAECRAPSAGPRTPGFISPQESTVSPGW